MTVDMLAATFFWPEGALLGSLPPHPDGEADAAVPEPPATDPDGPADGFWSAVMRHLWRPSPSATGAR